MVDARAWEGHGSLAFVSAGQLEVLSDQASLSTITGPPGGGFDSNPQWSPDGEWLAFLHPSPRRCHHSSGSFITVGLFRFGIEWMNKPKDPDGLIADYSYVVAFSFPR
jgi:hypothetical protein